MPLDKAFVPVSDRGFMLADGVYEVIAAYHGKMLWAEQHLDRLDSSLKALNILNPFEHKEWLAIINNVIDKNPDKPQQGIYIQVTRGVVNPRSHTYDPNYPENKPTVLVQCSPAIKKPYQSGDVTQDPQKSPKSNVSLSSPNVSMDDSRGTINKSRNNGLACITVEDIRWQRCDIKSINRIANVMMSQAAKDAGAAEAIAVRDGKVLEGASSNFFIIIDKKVITPAKSHHILGGITRDLVLQLAGEAGYACLERDVLLDELFAADEVWITSSTREIAPLVRLDDKPVGKGVDGPVWQDLIAVYHNYIDNLS